MWLSIANLIMHVLLMGGVMQSCTPSLNAERNEWKDQQI